MPPNPASQAQDPRRISGGDPVMSFLKANPTIITKPASPTPPPQQQPMVNLMEPPASTPRVPTPRRHSSVSPILQQAFFPQQNPGSPRVPSPISKSRNESRLMEKPTICICENKHADQLRSNCEADQRLCFRYSDSTIPLLLKSEISSF